MFAQACCTPPRTQTMQHASMMRLKEGYNYNQQTSDLTQMTVTSQQQWQCTQTKTKSISGYFITEDAAAHYTLQSSCMDASPRATIRPNKPLLRNSLRKRRHRGLTSSTSLFFCLQGSKEDRSRKNSLTHKIQSLQTHHAPQHTVTLNL